MKGLHAGSPIPESIDSIKALKAQDHSLWEVYGFRQGVADGEENSPRISLNEIREVQKHPLSITCLMVETFIANPKLWNSLSASNKKMLKSCN
jgi:TRAP-type C4-dicarboxylate transport system substrate-binding protein